MSLNRRAFMAGSVAAATLPAPTFAANAKARRMDADVIIVGAGAAGIAAARRVMAAGRHCLILEAGDRIGGRCFTEAHTFGIPFDRGAHWIHDASTNPLAKLGRAADLDIAAAPVGQKLRVGPRFGREGEVEGFLAALVRANRAIRDANRKGHDPAAARLLPRDLGDWRPTVEFVLGPLGTGKSLTAVSSEDFAHSFERDDHAFCREGYGALLARLAAGLPVRLSTPVDRVATWRGINYVHTRKGTLEARTVIVTASTAVLAAGRIKFEPALPRRHAEAFARLTLGTYERVALELPGNPLGLDHNDLVFEKARDTHTAALLANVSGSSLCYIDVAGPFAAELNAKGPTALRTFAVGWLADLFGNDVKKKVRRSHATQWAKDPWILGAGSVAPPGAAGLRRVFDEPVRDRVFFAGEAASENLWGTVEGAWESGERAADRALRLYGIRSR
jgi:monoamine oxidase